MRNEPLEEMINVLVALGPFAYGHEGDLTSTAREWLDHGFSPDAAHEWIDTGKCFDAGMARQLARAGLDPDQAGSFSKGKAIGWLVAKGDMTVAEANTLTEPLRVKQAW
jgi:hypothetical protein